ncbi:MAG: hypothetical protein HWN67_10170 [Candidatus Helarchaeota archaeon]|nr:hypothetical protein [Candidatus Helarchaeota archaeon]
MNKTKNKQKLLEDYIITNEGILQLSPTWVPRAFLSPGRRLKLINTDLYALGKERGGITERWLASTTNADNGPGTPEDEGLSYIIIDPKMQKSKILLKEAIDLIGDEILGKKIMVKHKGWMVLTKFFDNMDPIPFHIHQDDIQAKEVNRLGKPEAYYFPEQLNFTQNNFPYTFFGLIPGTTKKDIQKCLMRWDQGDNGILNFSKAYHLEPGTGWSIPPRILHGPGTLVTYEIQKASDVFAMFQSLVGGNSINWDLVIKDVPQDKYENLEYIVDLIDWEANLDPNFKEHHFCAPKPVNKIEDMNAAGYEEHWVIYGMEEFSGKRHTIFPGQSIVIKENAAYGLIAIQGYGTIDKLPLETPTQIRYGEITNDEYFITYEKAKAGVTFTNLSKSENLVILKHFGPN